MLCDVCHTREAKIFYTEIINGQKKEQHLCETCAGEQTLAIKDKLGEISIGTILSGILQNYAKGIAGPSANEPVCMRCGMTASEMVKNGRLGCPECYNAFSMILDKNLRTVQGTDGHHGKVPVNAVNIKITAPVNTAKTAAEVMKEATDEIARKNDSAKLKKEKKAPVESGSSRPAGKTAKKKSSQAEKDLSKLSVAQLKVRMTAAIEAEDYDEAARLRDEIKARK